ncbi:MAG: hypothetical protein DCC58_08840 [Chloroflexi bacterium]|nr:MAG: hypothetical protein DCC58_08840 [Chloroflexota bacterium]
MSDLGTVDGYAAALKGAILNAVPRPILIDITHHIPNRDVTEAAFQLAVVFPVFPAGTVHLVVVDSATAGNTRGVCVEIGGHFFVAPDNGVLTLAMANTDPERAVALDRDEFRRPGSVGSFEARDLFAPVAGALASGSAPFESLGTPLDTTALFKLPWTAVVDAPGRVHAPVVSVDRHGNCRTLITRQHLQGDLSRMLVRCGDVLVRGIHESYADVAVGKTLALFGSHGGLELAVRGGSAAASWELQRGDVVVVSREDVE